jgi:hypothetical protein
MHRSRSTVAAATCVAAISLLASLPGCGTSEYNRLSAKRLADVRGEMKFRSLFRSSRLGDTPIKIRVPMFFRDSFVEDSKHRQDGPRIHPQRVQPPFLPLPGFKICYEGSSLDPQAGGRVPFYCYLAALPAKPGDTENLAKELQAKLKDTFKDTPDEYETVDAESPTGKAVQWRKLRVVGDQKFRFVTAKGIDNKDLPGIFELWIREESGYTVLVAWRTPVSVEGQGSAPAASGPLGALAAPAPADAKIDLTLFPALTAGTLTFDAGGASDQQ